jgi:REP element-mobilizing transposase RayT
MACFYFMWPEPVGYMLTWTTYGTWLHGDARGSWNAKANADRDHFVPPDLRFENYRKSQLKAPPLLLDAAMRRIVREAIEDQCAYSGWELMALNVRTNHVHPVLPTVAKSASMLQQLKARATRLLRENRLLETDRPVWTTGGSTTLVFSQRQLTEVIHYVKHRQGKPLPEE